MGEMKVEHVLLFLVGAFLVYHMMGKCRRVEGLATCRGVGYAHSFPGHGEPDCSDQYGGDDLSDLYTYDAFVPCGFMDWTTCKAKTGTQCRWEGGNKSFSSAEKCVMS